jgi:hypothetical protein
MQIFGRKTWRERPLGGPRHSAKIMLIWILEKERGMCLIHGENQWRAHFNMVMYVWFPQKAGTGCAIICSSLSFVVYLTTILEWLRLYSAKWRSDKWMMNWKGCGKKQSWANFNVLSQHLPGGMRKTMKTSDGIGGLRVEIWTRDLPIKKQEC